MEYYYISKDNINTETNEIIIEGDDFKHLSKVLRKKTGDYVIVTDGELNIYKCRIISNDMKKIICRIESRKYNLYEPGISLNLFIAPLKNVARFEFAVEKAVELGVKSIQPVMTEHTIIKSKFSNIKMERICNIIKRATGQSQRCFLPEFRNIVLFSEMLSLTENKNNKIVMYEFSDDRKNIISDKISNEYNLLIGPEGGFSKEEVNKLTNAGWILKSLGERKLRAETAAIVSVYNLILNLTIK